MTRTPLAISPEKSNPVPLAPSIKWLLIGTTLGLVAFGLLFLTISLYLPAHRVVETPQVAALPAAEKANAAAFTYSHADGSLQSVTHYDAVGQLDFSRDWQTEVHRAPTKLTWLGPSVTTIDKLGCLVDLVKRGWPISYYEAMTQVLAAATESLNLPEGLSVFWHEIDFGEDVRLLYSFDQEPPDQSVIDWTTLHSPVEVDVAAVLDLLGVQQVECAESKTVTYFFR